MDAEKLKEVRESLDTVWEAISDQPQRDTDRPYDTDWDAVSQEFASLITTIARHRNSPELWALIGSWAGEKA